MGWLERMFGSDEGVYAPDPPIVEVDFIAIDVETAASSRASICQFGAVGFRDGREVFAYQTFLDPGCAFAPFNVAIHGITPDRVRGAPTYARAHGAITALLAGRVVAAHSNFDRGAIGDACLEQGLCPPACRWIDTVQVARRAWPDLANHKLRTLADHFGHSFKHHDALEDARVAGLIMIQAMQKAGTDLEHWLSPPRGHRQKHRVARAGGGLGPFAGERVVLTGDFTAPKPQIADLIAGAGGAVSTSVSKRITTLVLGRQTGPANIKSNKRLAAEALIAAGYPISIITEAQMRARLAAA